MSRLKPDPTFYPSPKMAMEAPPEKYGYVAITDQSGCKDPVASLEPLYILAYRFDLPG